jgi:hypothetical protein
VVGSDSSCLVQVVGCDSSCLVQVVGCVKHYTAFFFFVFLRMLFSKKKIKR